MMIMRLALAVLVLLVSAEANAQFGRQGQSNLPYRFDETKPIGEILDPSNAPRGATLKVGKTLLGNNGILSVYQVQYGYAMPTGQFVEGKFVTYFVRMLSTEAYMVFRNVAPTAKLAWGSGGPPSFDVSSADEGLAMRYAFKQAFPEFSAAQATSDSNLRVLYFSHP